MLVGVGSACSVLGGDDNDPASDSAAGVVDDLAVALSAHSLDDVPLTDDADRAAFAELVAPLDDVPVAVQVHEVDEVEPSGDGERSATATLDWSWELPAGSPWTYRSTVAMRRVGDSWRVDWTPESLAPTRGFAASLLYTTPSPPDRSLSRIRW